MGAREFLFGSLERVMINIEPEKAVQAEEIFAKYAGIEVFKRNVSHMPLPLGFAMEFTDESPNKVSLCYLVKKVHHSELVKDLVKGDVAGYSRHHPVYSRAYSLVGRIKEKLRFMKIEVIVYFRRLR